MIDEDLNITGSKAAWKETGESWIWQAQLRVWPLWWPSGEGHHPTQLLHRWHRGHVQGKHRFWLAPSGDLGGLMSVFFLCSTKLSPSALSFLSTFREYFIKQSEPKILGLVNVLLIGAARVSLCGSWVPRQHDEAGGGLQGHGVHQHLSEVQTGLQLTGGWNITVTNNIRDSLSKG